MISVGIIGSSGYTGKYLTRILSNHGQVKELVLYGDSSANKYLAQVHPDLLNFCDDVLIHEIDDSISKHDVIFTALPHGKSMKFINEFFNEKQLFIDLSGDFRFEDVRVYEKWYNTKHLAPELLDNAKYSLADISDIDKNKKIISNPGCYSTASLLSMLPLTKLRHTEIYGISTVAYSGVSGAGNKLKEDFLFPELDNNIYAYKVNNHQHEPEINNYLKKTGINTDYSFVPHLMPVFAGIYATTVVFTEEAVDDKELKNVYGSYYQNSPFVRVKENPPKMKNVIGTNYCDISVSARENKIVINAAIDNLIKGASGQAVQNMNKYFGFNESEGLIKI